MRKAPQQSSRIRTAVLLLMAIAFLLAVIVLFLPRKSATAPPARRTGSTQSAAEKAASESVPEEAPEAEAAVVQPDRSRPEKKPWERVPARDAWVSVVIDDAGQNLDILDAFLRFPGKITIAVLPHLPYSAEAARKVLAAGKDVILHCPMEARDGNDPGPGAILASQSEDEIRRLLDEAFATVPGARGMNNHMGSSITENPRVLGVVMEYLQENGKFFLDSRTTSLTAASGLAGQYNVPYLERSVFLDNETTAEAIGERLDEGLLLAVDQGGAVIIGHVHNEEVISVLGEMYPRITAAGIRVVGLSELLERKTAGR